MGILSTLLSKVLPKALNIFSYAGQGIVQGIQKNGLDGYRLQLAGYSIPNSDFNPLDGPIDENDAGEEQVLQQHVGANKEQVVAGLIAAREMSNAVLYSSLTNCKTETVTLEANLSFYYSKTAKTGTRKDGVPVINYKDHGYTHLIPKLFRNYDSLKRYDAFVLNMVIVQSTQASTSITGTIVSFYPLTKDTRKLKNSVVKSAGNRQESSTYNRIYYVIRNVTPGRFKITRDGFEPKDATVNPNEAIPTDVLDKYDSTDMDTSGSFLSYGTLCFVKENLGENDVAMQFNIKMQFIGFRQQSLDDIYDDDGSTEMSPITTNCLPKKFLKKKNLN
ncbi:hypothetical protein EDI_250270 [Entamoeba dispar SAW760]|uniref:Uncharacterized protein n=1 Tax=Entamoeba dispar (strain ATCC PRA-260 / SAW760) TaxID=370354 RepID=B0ES31_ENTDS|nr:uncharacterized protein EDI_250270 [Entamoeba dispar SAW760]EDR22679.1 hypothetical protein EDI_250270 [Entamoeba dispar SAW760]|eukprot:EDR22679.1 hypothetical protein EDI_250270 [Entamoeba dispar SAW760]